MAVFADVVDEWKKAGPKEKLLIAGGGAAVIVLALYLHSKSTGSNSTPGSSLTGTGTAGVGGSFQPANGTTQPTTGAVTVSSSVPPTPGQPLPPPLFKGPPLQKPPGGITPAQVASTSAPRQQTNAVTSVYAATRHAPSAMPVQTLQSAPIQQRPR